MIERVGSFEELLEGREFGCKVDSRRKQHHRQGDYWASLQRFGKANPFGGTAGSLMFLEVEAAEETGQKTNKGEEGCFILDEDFFGLGFHLVVSGEVFKNLRQHHVKVKFALERSKPVHHDCPFLLCFFLCYFAQLLTNPFVFCQTLATSILQS